MGDILERIAAYKLKEVAAAEAERPLAAVVAAACAAPPVRPFAAALQARIGAGGFALIAEIKKASPSRGLIGADFDPAGLGAAYAAGGATALGADRRALLRRRAGTSQGGARGLGLPVLRRTSCWSPTRSRKRARRRRLHPHHHGGRRRCRGRRARGRSHELGHGCHRRGPRRGRTGTCAEPRLPPDRHQQPRPQNVCPTLADHRAAGPASPARSHRHRRERIAGDADLDGWPRLDSEPFWWAKPDAAAGRGGGTPGGCRKRGSRLTVETYHERRSDSLSPLAGRGLG